MLHKKLSAVLLLGMALLASSCAPEDDSAPRGRTETDPPAPLQRPLPPEASKHLKARIDAALQNVRSRDMLKEHSFWTIFHGILGVGPDNAYLFDTQTGKRIKAIEFVCAGGPIRGLELYATADGVDVRTMAGSGVGQGHQDQFVAEMVQWGLPRDKKFKVNGKVYPFADFINNSKARVRLNDKQELSWAIIIVGQDFGTDITWTNNVGEKIAYEEVVRYELNEPIIDCPVCGGTHRLFGLTWAYYLHRAQGGKKVGVWKDVANALEHFKELTRKYQNRDGSFSTSYFQGPGNVREPRLRLASSGHIFEWLALALRDDELRAPWVQKAAYAVAQMILENRDSGMDGGALYHAAHGLGIYRMRVFGRDGKHSPVIPPVPRD